MDEVTAASTPKNTTPTIFRSISGFAVPSMHHNYSPPLYFPIFETSATTLCGPIGIFHHCCMIFSILYIRRCIQHSGVFLRFLKTRFLIWIFYFYMHTYFLLMSHICIHILSTQFHKFPWVCQTKSKVRHTFVNCLDPLSCCLKVQNFNQIVKGWLNPGWQTQRSWTG